MIFLVLSICISSLLFVIFKLFAHYKIDTLQAIVVNYLVAFGMGMSTSNLQVSIFDLHHRSWFAGAMILGLLFVTIFNVMALTSQKNGLSVASVAGKMSVVIPVIFGVLVYKDSLGVYKLIGILLALLAVYLTATKKSGAKIQKSVIIFPILLFFGSGVIDTSLKYVETKYVNSTEVPLFLASIFLAAFVLGILFMVLKQKTNLKIRFKNILAGIILGVPNYYSIDFLLKALKTEGLESSTLFTINNVSIVLLTTFFGVLFFQEKLAKKNWIGVLLATISIIMLTIGS